MKCPICNKINLDNSLKCDCGYDFDFVKMNRKAIITLSLFIVIFCPIIILYGCYSIYSLIIIIINAIIPNKIDNEIITSIIIHSINSFSALAAFLATNNRRKKQYYKSSLWAQLTGFFMFITSAYISYFSFIMLSNNYQSILSLIFLIINLILFLSSIILFFISSLIRIKYFNLKILKECLTLDENKLFHKCKKSILLWSIVLTPFIIIFIVSFIYVIVNSRDIDFVNFIFLFIFFVDLILSWLSVIMSYKKKYNLASTLAIITSILAIPILFTGLLLIFPAIRMKKYIIMFKNLSKKTADFL